MKEGREGLERRKLERTKNKNWYQDWLSTCPWGTTLLPSVLGPFIKGLLLLISFGSWTFNHLTGFIKQQIDSLIAKAIQVHYHCLAMEASDGRSQFPSSPPSPPSIRGLFQQALSWR